MWKTILILTTILLLSVPTIQVQADEISQEKDLIIKLNSDKRNSRISSRFSDNSRPNKDFTISDGISAGLIFGLESNDPNNLHSLTSEEKGYGIGLGFSFSF